MKIELTSIKSKLIFLVGKIRRSLALIFIFVALSVYGFMFFRVSRLTNAQPTQESLNEKLITIKKSKIDQTAVDKIQKLQDQNIQVQAIFKQARDNPFQE